MTYDYAYSKRWRYERSHGIKRTTDVTEVALHIAACQGAGMSLRAIAGAAGVTPGVLSNVMRRQQQIIKTTTAAKILAVKPGVTRQPSKQTSEPFVPKVGAVRRVRALLAIGWTHDAITEAAGLPRHGSAHVLHQQGRWLTLTTHEAVAKAYRELSGRPGPSQVTRTRAAKLGYLPPTEWDDIDHDPEPYETAPEPLEVDVIDDVAIDRALAGDRSVQLTNAERDAAIDRWLADGGSLNELGRRVGWNVHRHLRKAAA